CLAACGRLAACLTPAQWDAVDAGGHGKIVLEFDDVLFQAETSRICRIDRPRWWIVGTGGGFVKFGIDPQEDALRGGDIDRAAEPPAHEGVLRGVGSNRETIETCVTPIRGHWDGYYQNIAERLQGVAPLAVTAEQARDVVRVLEGAVESAREGRIVQGPWGEG